MNEKNNFELVESKLAQLASPGIRPGLARLARLLREAGSPQGKFPIVHIVGTNGKGSTAAGIYSVLRASGYKALEFIPCCARRAIRPRSTRARIS